MSTPEPPAPTPSATPNMCDGCQRGLPLVKGIHRGASPFDLIGCTADRYAARQANPNSAPCHVCAMPRDNHVYEGRFKYHQWTPLPPASAPAATASYPDACTRDGGAVCDAAGEVCPCMKDSPARPAATAGTEPQVGDEFVEMEASDGEWSELVATITRVIEPSPDRKGCWLVEWMEPGSDRVPAVFTEKYGEEFGKARYRQTLIEFRDGRWRRPIYADDLTCPCGAALVREGEVVKSHWKGAICGDCEAVLFARHPSSRPAAPSGEEAGPGFHFTEPRRCVECEGCGFAFDATHEDEPGDGYTCPLCEHAEYVTRATDEMDSLRARLATAEAERDRLRSVETHRAEILNALDYCSHERILDLLDFPGFQLESLTEAEEQRAAFKAAGIALSDLLRAPSTGGTP